MLLRPFVRNGRPGLIGRMADTTVIVGVARRQRAKAQQATVEQPEAPVDPVAQLKELAALKEQGILTEAEFQDQKSRILG